jgi:acetyltransferase-like isoleucine patch superfamily enzyme
MKMPWMSDKGVNIAGSMPPLHPRSWVEAPVVIQAQIAPHNLIQIGAFTGVYGGRIGHSRIGRYCSIAPGVDIASDQHPVNWLSSSMLQYVNNVHGWGAWLQGQGETYCPPSKHFESNATVEIGNDVWIGQGVFVKSGVKIGDGAVVGARSVVIDDVPPYSIVVGAPARVKRYRFDDATIARMLDLQWWKYNIAAIRGIDFSNVNAALDRIAESVSAGELAPFNPPIYNFMAE